MSDSISANTTYAQRLRERVAEWRRDEAMSQAQSAAWTQRAQRDEAMAERIEDKAQRRGMRLG